MNRLLKSLLSLAFLMIGTFPLIGQQSDEWNINAEEMDSYREQAGSLVKFFEGSLNFLGDVSSSVQEKEIIINESYSKIFVDEEVQIEDDLDEQRDVPINKDVRAYLKDVDFFFRSASFHFDIQNIESMVNEKGEIYFKVTLNRILKAVDLSGKNIESSLIRYLEVNLDPFKKELLIASYYTTKLNEKEDRRNWWAGLDNNWRNFFGKDIFLSDNIAMKDVYQVLDDGLVVGKLKTVIRQGYFFVMGKDTLHESERHLLKGRAPDTIFELNDRTTVPALDTLFIASDEADHQLHQFSLMKRIDISMQASFNNLDALTHLNQLEEVNISYTPIADITPLRTLNQLRKLSLAGTAVKSLHPLQYSGSLIELDISQTPIQDIEVITNFNKLEKLSASYTAINNIDPLSHAYELNVLQLSNTAIKDITPLSELENLRILDLSNTLINQLSPLAKLKQLQQLHLDFTAVKSISDLSGLNALNLLHISNTEISDLSPLQDLTELKRVYCDNSNVTAVMASAFARSRPDVLVVFDSEELSAWWENLPLYWHSLFSEQTGISHSPTTEELHQLISTQRLDLSGNKYLIEMQAISRMSNLKELAISNTEITDLSPVRGLNSLQKLDISQTRIEDLSILSELFQLQELNISKTSTKSLEMLKGLNNLKLVWADDTQISSKEVFELKLLQPNITVVYQTPSLRSWWTNLPDNWRRILTDGMEWSANPSARELQLIADRRNLAIHDQHEITNLEPILPLLFLEKLELNGTRISDIKPLSKLILLKHLELPGNPLTNIAALENLSQLEVLNLESTPLSDISVLGKLSKLKKLNLGGTQIKNLKAIASLNELEELSIYNTKVKNIQLLDKMPTLKHLKCYNTRISKKTIDKFKAQHNEINILYY